MTHFADLWSAQLARLPLAIAVVDERDELVDGNPRLRQWLGINGSVPLPRKLPIEGRRNPNGTRPEVALHCADGRTRWVRVCEWPVEQPRDGARCTVLALDDITSEKVSRARAQLDSEFAHVRRISSIMAHHVRNPLAGVSGALTILRDRLPLDVDDRAIVGEILERLGTLNDSVEDLVSFGRPLTPSPYVTSLQDIVRTALTPLMQADPQLKVTVATGDPQVWADPLLANRALHHVLTNAIESMDNVGSINIDFQPTYLGSSPAYHIAIRDSGGGIPEKVLPHVFDPLFTTKSKHMGLGLPLARRILHSMGGDLVCTRTSEQGTELTATLLCEDPDASSD